jgi:acetolactate synthase-1/2/3 large subunit
MTPSVHPGKATEALLRAVLPARETIGIFAEASSSMLFLTEAIRNLRLAPYFRISTHYGSMGHAIGGAVGFAAATGMRAVVLSGDGSFHLMNPMPVAVKHGLDITMVVLNNGMLGLPYVGSKKAGTLLAQATTHLEPWDFTCQGSPKIGGRRVFDEAKLDAALVEALFGEGCFILDVLTDPSVAPPAVKRFDSVAALFRGTSPPLDLLA